MTSGEENQPVRKDESARPDADPSRLCKRSVTVAGHRTSVSLEEAFWVALQRIATARGRSVSELIADIDRGRSGNLSSAIRVFVLAEVAAAADPVQTIS
jgi:predicted DNA-binding ribbon-helix-helix protein